MLHKRVKCPKVYKNYKKTSKKPDYLKAFCIRASGNPVITKINPFLRTVYQFFNATRDFMPVSGGRDRRLRHDQYACASLSISVAVIFFRLSDRHAYHIYMATTGMKSDTMLIASSVNMLDELLYMLSELCASASDG